MRLLLDTHVFIWWALGNESLSIAGRTLIEDDSNEVGVSVASVWEIAIKTALARADALPMDAHGYLNLAEAAGFPVIPIFPRHALAVQSLAHHHGDPFDRLLVAIAQTDTYRFVTHDKALAAYGDHVIVV